MLWSQCVFAALLARTLLLPLLKLCSMLCPAGWWMTGVWWSRQLGTWTTLPRSFEVRWGQVGAVLSLLGNN